LGGKFAVLTEHPFLPDITLIGYIELPFTPRTSDQARYWSPDFIIAFENELNSKLDVSYNIGIKQSAFSSDYALHAALSSQLELSSKFDVFAEYFGQYQLQFLPSHNIDCGVMYLLTDNFQFDVSMGSSIFNENINRFLNIGLSARFQ
jgi:hypothetical protein